MTAIDTVRLREYLARYVDSIPGLADIAAPSESGTPAELIDRYDQCYPLLEQALWAGAPDFDALLDCYQALFREQETLIRQQANVSGTPDARYRFILSIPVADRPSHLRACLESIYRLCECFGYGGTESGVYSRIQVVIADDSREQDNIRQHIELAKEYRQKGLQVIHFGQDEQYQLLQSIPESIRNKLGNILTTQPRDRFYLKGQAANRNLSVLKCLQLTEVRDRTLYYFVDSDELFCVNRVTDAGEQTIYALNYFYYIDRAFRGTDTLLITGKMVGDPPVSPAVMAANFLNDVTAFFTDLAHMQADQACRFHGMTQSAAAGAVYHDMAGLFGYENRQAAFPYRCPLEGKHDHAACLRRFAQRLAGFFFGEHLTRNTVFAYGNGFNAVTPARTVYPGNTIASHAGLKYIIPFGHLRLRMSGPTAGRLIAVEIEGRFASINLPHLHRRTTEAGLEKAFRPGVVMTHDDPRRHPGRTPDLIRRETRDPASAPGDTIEISDEFERQFFGDLMLFTTEELVKQADIRKPFSQDDIEPVMERKEQELLELYQQKHDAIVQKNRKLDTLVFSAGHWWLADPNLTGALQQVRAFIDNIDHNFGARSPAWQQIRSAEHRQERKQQIMQALMNYRTERDAWDSLFQTLSR